MNNRLMITVACLIMSLMGCATAPSGPKLFSRAKLIVKADGAITVPPDLPKEFVETIRARAMVISLEEMAKQGDMTITEECTSGTMKVSQDITAISMSQNQSSSRGFFGGLTTDTKQQVSISTSLRLEDCRSGKLIYSYDYVENGVNPAKILQTLVSYNIYLAYYNQYPR